MDWQPVIAKVERRLERWQTRVLFSGGRLVLLQLVPSAIPVFYLSMFKPPVWNWKELRRTDDKDCWTRQTRSLNQWAGLTFEPDWVLCGLTKSE